MLRIGALPSRTASGTAGNSLTLKHPAVFSRLRSTLLGAAPKGPNTDKLRCRSLKVVLCTRWISHWRNPICTKPLVRSVEQSPYRLDLLDRAACVRAPCGANEKLSAEGCPAHCAGAASCLSVAKAIRVLAASLRTEHRSEPARFAPARNPGVFFLCLLSFGQAKESESHSSAKQKVRRTGERPQTQGKKTA